MAKKKLAVTKHYYASPTYASRVIGTEAAPMDVVLSNPDAKTDDGGPWAQWDQDCETWRGLILTGRYAHWCPNWNQLPMDETCPEWPCQCGIEYEVDHAD